jgi:hypothetical protein
MSLTKGSAMSYRVGQKHRSERAQEIPSVPSPENTELVEEQDSSEADVSRVERWLGWLLEPADPDDLNPEGSLYAGHAYAPSVVARYRGPLRESDEYVDVLSTFEKGGFTSLLTPQNGDATSRKRLGRRSSKTNR